MTTKHTKGAWRDIFTAKRVATMAQHLRSPDGIAALVVEVLDWGEV